MHLHARTLRTLCKQCHPPLEVDGHAKGMASDAVTCPCLSRAGGAARTALEELEVALDAMCIMQAPFHHRYQVSSGVHRRVGGQGVVQFAGIAGRHDRVRQPFEEPLRISHIGH